MKYLGLIFGTLFLFSANCLAQNRVNPVITEYGGIFEMPEAIERPSPDITYNVFIDVRSGPETPDQINPALNNIARLLNLHAVGGVDPQNINVKAVIHNLATPVIATNELYNQKFGIDNPNIELIQALTDAGVELYVCGQSMLARDFPGSALNANITQSVSALTMVTQYQLEGYALLTF